MGTGRFFPRG